MDPRLPIRNYVVYTDVGGTELTYNDSMPHSPEDRRLRPRRAGCGHCVFSLPQTAERILPIFTIVLAGIFLPTCKQSDLASGSEDPVTVPSAPAGLAVSAKTGVTMTLAFATGDDRTWPELSVFPGASACPFR